MKSEPKPKRKRIEKYSGIKLELHPELKRLEGDYDKFINKKKVL